MVKPKDLLSKNDLNSQLHLDNLLTKIFGTEHPTEEEIDDYYIMSEADTDRYKKFNLKPDMEILKQTNPFIPDFEHLGNNEKIILNKIFFGTTPLTIIVATIGAGKTSLCKFLKKKIDTTSKVTHQPIQIYINLNELPPSITQESRNDKNIQSEFCLFFKDELEQLIESIIPDIKDEVIEWWNYIFSERAEFIGPTFKKIRNELRHRNLRKKDIEAEPNYVTFTENRLKLRDDIMKEPYEACAYLCELISHIRARIFGSSRWGIILYIDNLDRSSAFAQIAIRTPLLSLLKLADVRSIVSMRISTWRMSANNAFTYPIDFIPHTGPSPLRAVIERLQSAKNLDPVDYGIVFDGGKSRWMTKIDDLIRILERPNSEVARCLISLSGFNIRKAFVLAQELVASIEQPADQDYLRDHHLKRMMISQGSPNDFEWRPNGVVDNLFQIHANGFTTPLVKVRILQALKNANDARPVHLDKLVEILRTFGHDSDCVRYALNEMMEPHKRIVWADSVMRFINKDDFQAANQSKIFAGTAANGYLELLKDFDYLREMAMDTSMPSLDLSELVKQGQEAPVWLRFEAILKFARWLWETDVVETVNFFKQWDISYYTAFFSKRQLLVSSFLPECLNQFERIIGAYQGNRLPELKKELEDLRNLLSMDFNLYTEDSFVTRDEYGNEILVIGGGESDAKIQISLNTRKEDN